MKKRTWLSYLLSVWFGERVSKISLLEEEQVQSPMKTMLREFFRRKLTIIGLIGFGTMLLASTILPFFWQIDIRATDMGQRNQRPSMNMMRIPREIRGNIEHLGAAPGYGIAATYAGDIYFWGTVSRIAQPLMNPPQPGRPVRQVSAGTYHALVLTEDGYVYSWGNLNPIFNIHAVPADVQGRVVYVVAGMRMTMAITDTGELRTWGGNPIHAAEVALVGRVPRDEVPISVVANLFTFGVLTESGRVYVTMRTDRSIRNVPEEIQGRVVDIAMTDDNGAAILDDGTVVVWGDPTTPELFAIPAHIQGNAVAVDAGREHFTVILNDGSVASWGPNLHGRTNAPDVTGVQWMSVSGDHNYIMMADGSVQTWGLRGFILGTDDIGRCIWTRLWSGGRYTLLIGMVAVIVQGFIGLLLGGISGYYGGKVDMFLMRMAEVVGSLPFLPLAVILQFRFRHVFGPIGGMVFLMFVLGILSWPPLMRLVRAQILGVKESEYVLAARALGVRQAKLIFRHIMPNVISAAIVFLTLALAASMLTETALSFIGFGVSEPTPTWGNMLTGSNSSTVLRDQWWRWLFPAIALVTVAISINLIGDGLREATDPRSQGR